MVAMELEWLPVLPDWRERLLALSDMQPTAQEAARRQAGPDPVWREAVSLAQARLDFVRTNALDTAVRRRAAQPPAPPVRLAVLGTCTTAHLHPAIRVGALRRGIAVEIHEPPFATAAQALVDPASALHRFAPTAILFCLDAHHLTAGLRVDMDAAAAEAEAAAVANRIQDGWRRARAAFGCPILHQAALALHPPLLGGNEHRLAGSRAWFITRLNTTLRAMADAEGVDILAIDDRAARDGVARWHDPALWFRARQEIALPAAPLFGDLVGRWLAAIGGRSFKCLVLDLDNTLWGGVVGDDGLEGIAIGQGSPLGEAHAAFQTLARDLSRRGVILGVCSKNDLARALEPFEKHPDMVLRRDDIACFVANWSDKPANLRAIAAALNIGLDALVFADDNPFERELVRRELPMVAVPELGDDPARYATILAAAGYFDAISVTAEDRDRATLYRDNQAREASRHAATDLDAYLRGLGMRLEWRRFDRIGMPRITQLINKSNQFNLTTRRYTEQQVRAVMDDPRALGLQLRLHDRFGDNGVIAIVIARLAEAGTLTIDAWLMSCRVLGRQVEEATLNLLVEQARALGAERLLGRYVPTERNGMVCQHYERLGFSVTRRDPDGGHEAILSLPDHVALPTRIEIVAG
jgi:FkbH-like protein